MYGSKNIIYKASSYSLSDQINLLQKRGLTIDNIAKATHLLENLSYYRLSGYWYPFLQDKKNHKFRSNATFEKVFNLYCFDRKLRQLILSEIEKIEIALRAKMIYILSHNSNAFWFLDGKLFRNSDKHRKSLVKISNEYKRSDLIFINEFKNKYDNPYPPSWITLEILSMGTLSMLYGNLKPIRPKRDIADYFGIDKDTLSKWLHSLVYVRNICAHHSRLWNRVLGIQPIRVRKAKNEWLSNTSIANNKSYYILSIILYLLQTINPNNTFSSKLKQLFNEYPNVDLEAMGFPIDWEREFLWT